MPARFPLVLALCSAMIPMNAPVHAQTTPVLPAPAASPWQVKFAGPRGLSLAYRGVPILRRSSLYVVKPGWAGLLFDQRAAKATVTPAENGALRVENQNADFASRYDLRALDDRTFEIRFHGELRRDIPAEIEFAAGYFNANLIANRPFEAQNGAATSSGRVPAFPLSGELSKNELAPAFKSLAFASRIGKIRLNAQSRSRVSFADARRDTQNWAREAPVFWLGWMAGSQPLKFGAPVEMTLTLRVELPALPMQNRAQTVVSPAQNPVPDAFSTRDAPLEVVPRLQQMSVGSRNGFALRQGVKVSILAPRGETRLRGALEKILRDEWQIRAAAPRETAGNSNWCRIVIGGLPDPVSGIGGVKTRVWAAKTDAYRLRADGRGVEIEAPPRAARFTAFKLSPNSCGPQAAARKSGPFGSKISRRWNFEARTGFPRGRACRFTKNSSASWRAPR